MFAELLQRWFRFSATWCHHFATTEVSMNTSQIWGSPDPHGFYSLWCSNLESVYKPHYNLVKPGHYCFSTCEPLFKAHSAINSSNTRRACLYTGTVRERCVMWHDACTCIRQVVFLRIMLFLYNNSPFTLLFDAKCQQTLSHEPLCHKSYILALLENCWVCRIIKQLKEKQIFSNLTSIFTC